MRYLPLILTLIACAPTAPPGLVPRGAFDSCDGGIKAPLPLSLVRVFTDRAMCSGVVISPTEVLTAGHCLEGSTFAYVQHDAFPGEAYIVTHVAVNGPWGEDAALLHVRTHLPTADIGEPGDAVALDLAGYGCFSDGRVRLAQSRTKDFPFVHARPAIGCACKGDSGGPAYDTLGAVVGIMTHTDSVARVYITDITVLQHLRALMSALLVQYPEATDP